MESPKNVPLRQRYTTFYFVLLVLSTIGTISSIYGLGSLPRFFTQIAFEPVYALVNIFLGLIVTPLACIALLLLWRKQPLGIWLNLNTYGANVVCGLILLLFTEKSALDAVVKTAVEGTRPIEGISTETMSQIATGTFYGALISSIIISVVFALLWWFAWKRQAKKDGIDA